MRSMFDWVLLAGVAVSWGSLFLLTKKAMLFFSAWELTAVRYVLCLCCLAFFLPRAMRAVKHGNAWPLVVVAILGSGLPVLLLTLAQQRINSSTTAIINALTPLFAFLIGALFFRAQLSALRALGIAVGLAGVTVLSFAREGLQLDVSPVYAAFAIGAAISYGWTANYVRRSVPQVAGLDMATVTFAVTGTLSLALLVAEGTLLARPYGEVGLMALGCAALLSICSVLAVVGYYTLMQRRGALFATTCTYLTPCVALAWGLLDSEDIGLEHLLGLFMILSGVMLANATVPARRVL